MEITIKNLTTLLLFFFIAINTNAQPSNDECVNAIDISYAFTGECGETTYSGPFDLTGATAGVNDPPEPEEPSYCGINTGNEHPFTDLFGDDAQAWENSIWFSFTVPDLNGDGSPVAYSFWTSDGSFGDDCGLNPNNILNNEADTQVVIYENNCPTAATDDCDYFAANEDLFDTPPFISGWLNLEFTPGVIYYMGVDGWDAAQGEFCLTVAICGTECGDNVCSVVEKYCDCEECRVDENGDSTCTFGNIHALKFDEDEHVYYLSDDLSGNIFLCSEFVNGYPGENVYLGFGAKDLTDCSGYSPESINITLSAGKFIGKYVETVDNGGGSFSVYPNTIQYIELTPDDINAGSITISSSVPDGFGNTCSETITINFADFPQATDPFCRLTCFAGGIDTDILDSGITVCQGETFTLNTNGLEDLTLPCDSDDGSSYVYGWRLLADIYGDGDFSIITSWQILGTNPTIDPSTFFIDEFGYLPPGYQNQAGSLIYPIDPNTGELRKFQIQGGALCVNSDGTIQDGCLAANEGYENSSINVTYLPVIDSNCSNDGENNDDITGCTDQSACNFNPDANVFDGSCLWLDCNGECGGDALEDCEGTCEGTVLPGSPCTDVFGNESIYLEGCFCPTKILLGCIDQAACNFDPTASYSDDSCTYPEINFDCEGNCLIEVDCEGTCGGDLSEGASCVDVEGNTGVYTTNCDCQTNEGDSEANDQDNEDSEDSENNEADDGGQARIFENYSWLHSHMDVENCLDGTAITEFRYPGSNFRFLHMAEPDGLGSLFSQDGIYYCSDAPGYSCADSYNLTEVLDRWICGDNTTTSSTDENELINKYSWLNNYINTSDCEAGNQVTEYNLGSYSFIFIQDKEGSKLYLDDGTFYCANAPGYDCTAIYSLNNPTTNWACESTGENTDNNPQDEIFSTYNWLSTLVSENNCTNTSLSIYAYGSYQFISIENNEGRSLYFQDGTFYCADSPNYSCTNLYGLSTPISEWACEGFGFNQKIVEPLLQQKIIFDLNFKTYPNPSNGQFTVEFSENYDQLNQLKIINIAGKLIQSIKVEPNQKQMTINLANIAKGIYLIQLQNSNTIMHTQRIIIQ